MILLIAATTQGPNLVEVLFSALFGLIIGSFLNVIICRFTESPLLSEKEGISSIPGLFRGLFGRSRCPHCKKELVLYELVPLFSFAVQKRKCRTCNERISWQYPLVEGGTALAFALIAWQFFRGNL